MTKTQSLKIACFSLLVLILLFLAERYSNQSGHMKLDIEIAQGLHKWQDFMKSQKTVWIF